MDFIFKHLGKILAVAPIMILMVGTLVSGIIWWNMTPERFAYYQTIQLAAEYSNSAKECAWSCFSMSCIASIWGVIKWIRTKE